MAAIIMALGAAPALAGPNGSVDLFAFVEGNPEFGSCQGSSVFFPGFFSEVSFAIAVRLGGATANGLKGIECYIEGVEGSLADLGFEGSIVAQGTAIPVGDFFAPTDPDGDGGFTLTFTMRRGSALPP